MLYKINKGDIVMKVFISWSGARSKKVAQIFRDWLPTVIQSLDPFVSSEDIEKGSRWNTDIAQELKDSTFGLICVTKDNLNAPWLNFEAGALSKTIDNSYVAPLLFDVKPSELKGLPISQFQATSFTVEDMKRLVETLNTAAGNCLSSTRLDKAFELCYPDLEKSIKELKDTPIESENEDEKTSNTHLDPNILEELLEMTRNTQRLLGNTDTKLYNNLDQVQKKIDDFNNKMEKHYELDTKRASHKIRPIVLDEMMYIVRNSEDYDTIFPYNILIALSLYREDFPWLYDAGSEFVKKIDSSASKNVKIDSANRFKKILDFSCSQPVMRELFPSRKEFMFVRDLSISIMHEIDAYINKLML